MTTVSGRRLRILLAVLLLGAAGLTGCATHAISGADPRLLEFLHDGATTRDEIILKFGSPSASFEQERILTYRLRGDDKQGYFVWKCGTWEDVRYSLVLVFDEAGMLKKHSLVRV
jgi:hypothetical protein